MTMIYPFNKVTKIVNLTPHEIIIFSEDGKKLATLLPSGIVARVTMTQKEIGKILGMPVYKSVWGEVENLPPAETGTVYLVSQIVLQALNGNRPDVIAPNTALAVRDENGKIIGVRGFIGGY